MPAEAGLVLSGVRVGYHSNHRWPLPGRESTVVDEVDAVAATGQITAVLGPNGAGKSTLLRSITGLQPMLSGRVELSGVDLHTLSARERARRTAVVLTDRVEVGLLTGREVADLGRHPHRGFSGRLSDAERQLVQDSLAALDANSLADKRFGEMSDGQRQRVLLARALVQQPDLLVLDEPSAFLDVGARVDLMALLQLVAASEGMVVVISTHEVELALRMSDWIWLIDGSRLVAGTPEQLIADGSIGQVFETPHTHFDPVSRTFQLRT